MADKTEKTAADKMADSMGTSVPVPNLADKAKDEPILAALLARMEAQDKIIASLQAVIEKQKPAGDKMPAKEITAPDKVKAMTHPKRIMFSLFAGTNRTFDRIVTVDVPPGTELTAESRAYKEFLRLMNIKLDPNGNPRQIAKCDRMWLDAEPGAETTN